MESILNLKPFNPDKDKKLFHDWYKLIVSLSFGYRVFLFLSLSNSWCYFLFFKILSFLLNININKSKHLNKWSTIGWDFLLNQFKWYCIKFAVLSNVLIYSGLRTGLRGDTGQILLKTVNLNIRKKVVDYRVVVVGCIVAYYLFQEFLSGLNPLRFKLLSCEQ
jgi:hypothetical protein